MSDLRKVFVSIFVLVLVSLCAIPAHASPQAPPQVDVIATGLSNPRGIAFGPDGTLAGRYHKVQLLAFGEYMPFSNWIPQLKGLVEGVGDFRPGEKIEPLCWEDTCFGVLICFEAILKPISREFMDKGADFLVNITNDAWFGDTSCPEQHLMLSAFRAVENRTWLVRVANTGISAFVDPVGRILHRTAVFEEAVRVCRIDQPDPVHQLRQHLRQ